MTYSFYLLVALLGEGDEGKEEEVTLVTFLPQDCGPDLFLLASRTCLLLNGNSCLRRQGPVLNMGIPEPSLCAKYSHGETSEEVENQPVP